MRAELKDYDRAKLEWLVLKGEAGDEKKYVKGTVVDGLASEDVSAHVRPPDVYVTGDLPDLIIVSLPGEALALGWLTEAGLAGHYEYRSDPNPTRTGVGG
jgi:hypothetical protein